MSAGRLAVVALQQRRGRAYVVVVRNTVGHGFRGRRPDAVGGVQFRKRPDRIGRLLQWDGRHGDRGRFLAGWRLFAQQPVSRHLSFALCDEAEKKKKIKIIIKKQK